MKIKNPKTISDYRIKYQLTSETLDDLLIELYDHSQKNNWSDKTYKKKEEHFKRLYSSLFIRLNEWLVGFNLPKQNTITKAKKLLETNVFASVIDVKEKNYYNCNSKNNLRKYIKKYPHKKVNKTLAKDEGYRIFLEHLFF